MGQVEQVYRPRKCAKSFNNELFLPIRLFILTESYGRRALISDHNSKYDQMTGDPAGFAD